MMPRPSLRLGAVLVAATLFAYPGAAERPRKRGADAFAAATRGTTRHEGLLVLHVDRAGRVLAELPAAGEEREHGRFLWIESLVTGLGSNPVGLDRGQLGDTRLVVFRRLGGKILLEQPNLRFRALTGEAEERLATREAFVSSVLFAAEPLAEAPDGRVLIDLGPFLLQDAHGIAKTLARSGQGTFQLDGARSMIDETACRAFPDNLVFESLLTFSGSEPGAEVRGVAPQPEALSFRVRHQLVRLPPPGHALRPWRPAAGSFAIEFADQAAGLDEPLERRFIVRHRLEALEPGSARTRVRDPIVYHVDRGIPEPVRSAVLEGAGWWSGAFEAAGFDGAFRVELLPEGAHPLDLRYNVIQWVHRATRGWSYGTGVVDPRTGERLKGHVNLGSLRVRQDRLLIEGLASTEHLGDGGPDDPIQVALARIRQLAAHEVGHALGLGHAFAASGQAGGRASVMDYPAPLVRIREDGSFDFSGAYAVGAGAWDRHAIRLAYGLWPGGREPTTAELDAAIRQARERGLDFLSDADARPPGAAHPRASLWDNGSDAALELEGLLRVRRLALARFGESVLVPGRPLALLQERLAPVYFFHRYQVEAAAKAVGGLEYSHGVRGDPAPAAVPVPGPQQRRAVAALLSALAPEELDLRDELLRLLLPRPPGLGANRELFAGRSAPGFDALAAAASASEMVLAALFQRERGARLLEQHRLQPALPDFDEIAQAVEETVFARPPGEAERLRPLRRTVQGVALAALLRLAEDAAAAPELRARARFRLEGLDERLAGRRAGDAAEAAHRAELRAEIAAARERRLRGAAARPAPEPPPGPPIGAGSIAGCSLGDGSGAPAGTFE